VKTESMAFSNLGRNRKRTVLVILSLSLSIILTNTVFTLSQSVDVNKALKRFSDSDFLIGHADLFNSMYDGSDNALSESFISAVESQEGFEHGGRIYIDWCSYTGESSAQVMNKQPDGSYFTQIYGLESFPFFRLNLVDGEIDMGKLASGNYILEGVLADDNGKVDTASFNNSIGDKIILKFDNSVKEMTVLVHVIAKQGTNMDTRWLGSAFYLPYDVFREQTGIDYAMSYAFDVADDMEHTTEDFLKKYTESVEPTMNYKSKFTELSGLEGIRSTAVLVGGALALITGMIGILNFINAVLTSILIRRREFAILQSIGMTRKQLKSMLRWEGCCYAAMTAAVSVILSVCCSLLIVRPLSSNLWFMSFRFVLWPLAVILPVLFILAILIPMFAYRSVDRQSIVERLRGAV